MPRYRNASEQRRVFPHLVDPRTGTTLELDPDEEVTLPADIVDTVLVPVKKKGRVEVAPEPTPESEPEPEMETKEVTE